MRKRSQGKARRPERRTVQVQVLAHNDSIYQLYSRFGTAERRTRKEALKQTMLLLLWFAVLTTFFAMQNAILRTHISQDSTTRPVGPVTASAQALRLAERGEHPSL
jgi:hypothetical protein